MYVFSEALNILLDRWKCIVFALLLPVAASALIELVPMGDGVLAIMLVLAIQVILYACIAVAVHRIVLLGSGSIPTLGVLLYLSKRELRFAGMIVIFAVSIFVFALLMQNALSGFIAFACLLFFIPVFSIVFPATAVDSDRGFFELLNLGRYNYWLLVKATLLIPVLVGLLEYVLASMVGGLFSGVPELLSNVGAHLLGISILTMEIAVLSVAYAEIERNDSSAAVFGI